MAFYYDFERFLRDHPTRPDDPASLDVERAASNLIDLRASLDNPGSLNFVPPKSAFERLLLATWNIQAFGASRRYEESFWYIAEILSRFDLIAVQEVRSSLDELDEVCKLLGPWWKYVVTDVTEGSAGNDERLAYLFDSRKVKFGGLSGELVLPPIRDAQGNSIPARQIVRSPYIAGFKSGWFSFMLATVHLIFGDAHADNPLRVEEVGQVARFLRERLQQDGAWTNNGILLGDFNIFQPDGMAVDALREAQFQIPHGRADLRATNVGQEARFYDQIAYQFAGHPDLAPSRVGVIDFFEAVYTDDKFDQYVDRLRTADGDVPGDPLRYYRTSWRRRQMSDHLVLWTELPIDFADPYLQARSGN